MIQLIPRQPARWHVSIRWVNALVAAILTNGCAHYVNVSPREAARRPQDKIVAIGLTQIISAVTLTSGERWEFQERGAEYRPTKKTIGGITRDGQLRDFSLADISSVELRVSDSTPFPPAVVSSKDVKYRSSLWVQDTVTKIARPVPLIVKATKRTGAVDTLRHYAEAVTTAKLSLRAPFNAVSFVRLRVLPSIYARRAVGLSARLNSSRLTGSNGGNVVIPDWRSGYNLGAIVNYRLNERLSAQLEVAWSVRRATVTQSSSNDGAGISVSDKVRLTQTEISLLGKFRIFKNSLLNPQFVCGPFVSYARSSVSQFDSTYTLAGFVLGESGHTENTNLRRQIAGIAIGCEWSKPFGRVRPEVGVRYLIGLRSLYESADQTRLLNENPGALSRALPSFKISELSFLAGVTVPF